MELEAVTQFEYVGFPVIFDGPTLNHLWLWRVFSVDTQELIEDHEAEIYGRSRSRPNRINACEVLVLYDAQRFQRGALSDCRRREDSGR